LSQFKPSLKLLIATFVCFIQIAFASPEGNFIDNQIAVHPKQSGIYVMDKGEEALLARALLADHAEKTIEVQYFIWSTDTIGILAQKPY